MGNRFSIPTGAIPPKQLEAALIALTKKTAEQLHSHCPGYAMRREKVHAHYEETGKRREILPKCLQTRIVLRQGITDGASLNIRWKRNDPERVWIFADSSSQIEDYLFYATFLLATIIAMLGPFMIPGVRMINRVIVVVFFFPAWIALQIPYFGIRLLQRARNRCLLEKVMKYSRECLAADVETVLR